MRRSRASPAAACPALGMLANMVEFPAVPKGQARFRLQVMAGHSQHDIVDAVHRLSTAVADATSDLGAIEDGSVSIATLEAERPIAFAGKRATSHHARSRRTTAEHHARFTRSSPDRASVCAKREKVR